MERKDTGKSSKQKSTQKENEALRLTADLEGNYLLEERVSDLKWLGIFYAPTGGSVHRVAKILKRKIGAKRVEMFYISEIPATRLVDYKNIIIV